MPEVFFEDVRVGERVGTLDKGRITLAHVVRWAGAVENWHRIHYDREFATGHDGLPGLPIHGSWKHYVLIQLTKESLGAHAWLWRLRFRHTKLDLVGDAIRAHADVLDKQSIEGLGFVTLRVEICNERDEISAAGAAICAVPLRDGPPVPYPFTPTAAQQQVRLPPEERSIP